MISTNLSGRHALVTGGGRGIGLAVAKALLAQGARVTLAGREEAVLSASAGRLKSDGEAQHVLLDVTRRQSVRDAFALAVDRFGPVTVLVNNAGQAASATFSGTDESVWQQMLSVNLTGTFHCSQVALPAMLGAGWGRIINIASTAGLTGYRYVSAYCAAKHGVVGLTRALALEVAEKGITVNAVCPGFTDTEMTRETIANIVARTGRSEQQALQELAARNPQKRLIRPEEVADAVAWLCLPQASAINGQAIAVAGGEVM